MFKYLRLGFTAGIRLIWDFLFYIKKYAKHPEKYPLEVRYKKIHELVVYIIDKFRPDIKVKGLENLRKLEENNEIFFVTCNHQSNMDPIMMLYLSEKPISFISKIEAKKFPFIGKVIDALDGIYIERADLRQTLKAMIELSKRLENKEQSYMIFPEGTRNKELDKNLLLPYKSGAVKAAKKVGVKILPVCMYGNFRILPARPNYKRIPLEITIFETLDQDFVSENDTEAIMEKIYQMTYDEVQKQFNDDKEFFERGYEKIPLRKGSLR